jgi:sulfite exporter TauE/SafE
MEILSAAIIGLLGSLHCLGMCGPIALVLPVEPGRKVSIVVGRLLYNLGRIISYAFLGALFGIVGQPLHLGGYQQGLSIGLGAVILLMVFIPARYTRKTGSFLGLDKIFDFINRFWGPIFRNPSKPARLTVGILNGFLPCGFVYVGLAGAFATGNIWQGAAYMTLFGLGTVPMMLTLSLIGNNFGMALRKMTPKALPAAASFIALLFILRGLGLGIPYLSPKFTDAASVSESTTCCKEK